MDFYFNNDDKILVQKIVNEYHDSLNRCSSKEKLIDVGLSFDAAFKDLHSSLYFGDIEGIAAIVFPLDFVIRGAGIKRLRESANEMEPKYIKVYQRLILLYELYQKRLIIFNTQPIFSVNLPKVDSKENALRYHINENKIAQFVRDFHEAKILPSTELEYLANNDFLSQEQIRFNKERKIAITSLIIAFIAVIVAIIIPFIVSRYTETTIAHEQINNIINSERVYTKTIIDKIDSLRIYKEQIEKKNNEKIKKANH